jgi:hypothetical protein
MLFSANRQRNKFSRFCKEFPLERCTPSSEKNGERGAKIVARTMAAVIVSRAQKQNSSMRRAKFQ